MLCTRLATRRWAASGAQIRMVCAPAATDQALSRLETVAGQIPDDFMLAKLSLWVRRFRSP
jgi:hypothetical protein